MVDRGRILCGTNGTCWFLCICRNRRSDLCKRLLKEKYLKLVKAEKLFLIFGYEKAAALSLIYQNFLIEKILVNLFFFWLRQNYFEIEFDFLFFLKSYETK